MTYRDFLAQKKRVWTGCGIAADALPPITSVASTQLCKLLSNRFAGDPTANDVGAADPGKPRE